jgi:hypothetical protein
MRGGRALGECDDGGDWGDCSDLEAVWALRRRYDGLRTDRQPKAVGIIRSSYAFRLFE